jgi:hypothetical protein
MVPPVVMATASWGTPPTGNYPPVAVDDSYSTDQDTTLNIAAPGVLGNDSDADGDPMTAVLVDGVSNGTLALNSNGSFDYTPNTGFSGSDSFSYQAQDDKSELSNDATVLITVTPTGGGSTAGVSAIESGFYSGKGKSRTFNLSTVFTRGDEVIIRSTVSDGSNPVSGATVTTTISGPENATVTSEPSDANGIAEASWNTRAPKKNGSGGTTAGSYTATTSGVTADGYTWDDAGTSAAFQLD